MDTKIVKNEMQPVSAKLVIAQGVIQNLPEIVRAIKEIYALNKKEQPFSRVLQSRPDELNINKENFKGAVEGLTELSKSDNVDIETKVMDSDPPFPASPVSRKEGEEKASLPFYEPAKPGATTGGGPSGIFTTRQGAAHSRIRGAGPRGLSCGRFGPGPTCPCLARENTPRVRLSRAAEGARLRRIPERRGDGSLLAVL
jgi:hypothetical protein